jgi:transcriptional regulator with XRE-family HTH domain
MSAVGDRIRHQRQKLGYTQEIFAKAANISKGFLSEVETGTRNPSAEYLLRIATALGVSLDFLMRGITADSEPRPINFPASLINFGMKEGLPINAVKAIYEAKMQFIANRRDTVDDDLEAFDWRGFYEAIKEYL